MDSPRPRLTPPLRSRSNPSPRVAAPGCHRPRAPWLPRVQPRRADGVPCSSSTPGNLIELNDASDFGVLVNPDGYLSVVGFGSLLSKGSVRSTFPDLKNFRVAVLRGFRRVFSHVAPIFFEHGIANEATGEISSLSVEPCVGEWLIVTVFEIKREEVPAFIERENEFRFLAVVPEGLDGIPYTNPAVVCARYSDEEYFQIRCKGNKENFFQNYGRYNIHKIWRDDILPCRIYLRHCVLAAKNLRESAYNNFLDHTFLSDRKTSIRVYLNSSGSGIMEKNPRIRSGIDMVGELPEVNSAVQRFLEMLVMTSIYWSWLFGRLHLYATVLASELGIEHLLCGFHIIQKYSAGNFCSRNFSLKS